MQNITRLLLQLAPRVKPGLGSTVRRGRLVATDAERPPPAARPPRRDPWRRKQGGRGGCSSQASAPGPVPGGSAGKQKLKMFAQKFRKYDWAYSSGI